MTDQKHLWAPWKMDYLKNKKQDSQKIFSDFANEENDKKNLILHRAKYCYVIMNYYPYNNGHLMVITLSKKVMKILRTNFNCDGFNFGANIGEGSGASIESHLHFHIVPRWKSDTSFMPVIGNTKVMPQTLEDTYEQLLKLFKEEL
jgi:ATP adenylyltransferase